MLSLHVSFLWICILSPQSWDALFLPYQAFRSSQWPLEILPTLQACSHFMLSTPMFSLHGMFFLQILYQLAVFLLQAKCHHLLESFLTIQAKRMLLLPFLSSLLCFRFLQCTALPSIIFYSCLCVSCSVSFCDWSSMKAGDSLCSPLTPHNLD
jgi:hypothetical protein